MRVSIRSIGAVVCLAVASVACNPRNGPENPPRTELRATPAEGSPSPAPQSSVPAPQLPAPDARPKVVVLGDSLTNQAAAFGFFVGRAMMRD